MGGNPFERGVSAGRRGLEKGTYDITHGCQQAVHVGKPNRASVTARIGFGLAVALRRTRNCQSADSTRSSVCLVCSHVHSVYSLPRTCSLAVGDGTIYFAHLYQPKSQCRVAMQYSTYI